MNKDSKKQVGEQEHRQKSRELERRCYDFLYGLLAGLDSCLDRRLVETFLALVLVIIMHRNRAQGLLLSELRLSQACLASTSWNQADQQLVAFKGLECRVH